MGLIVAGASFTLPAAAITGVLAWGYAVYGSLPQVEPFLQGIKPVVLAIILAAVVRLGRTALRRWELSAIAAAVAVASIAGAGEVAALLLGGLLGVLGIAWIGRARAGQTQPPHGTAGAMLGYFTVAASTTAAETASAAACAVPLWKLGLFFLKVGAVLYGSGYVLVAYLEGGLVDDLGWLTKQQLVDAVAIGQITPGPVITTATFVGYLVAGPSGTALATAAIVLPGLVCVAIVHPWIARVRRSVWASRFLDAVNAGSVGLMAVVLGKLAPATVFDGRGAVLAVATGAALWRWKVSPAWLVLAGAIAGSVLW